MDQIDENLSKLGLKLPSSPTAGGNYEPYRIDDNRLVLSGVISVLEGEILTGKVGEDRSINEGRKAAEACALNALAVIKDALDGSFDRLDCILSVNGYVNGVSGFPDAPLVINGASDLLITALGEAGRHTRTAVTVAGLPKHAIVEIQAVAKLK